MHKTTFYPLRSVVGPAIPIKGIRPIPEPRGPFRIECRVQSLSDTVANPVYSQFLPDIMHGGIRHLPRPGMATLPIGDSALLPPLASGVLSSLADAIVGELMESFRSPSDNPFPDTAPVGSIFGYASASQLLGPTYLTNPLHSGRDETYSFEIVLGREALVGGICFSGYPYILSRLHAPEGMTIGNFGLPREIRLTPLPSTDPQLTERLAGIQRSQFIDSEFAYTRQEMISHSGLNYLRIDPVRTNRLILSFTDLPLIPKLIDLDHGHGLRVAGFKGFALPYLYVFEYKETTRRNARLHSGLLAVRPSSSAPLNEDGSPDVFREAFPEYEYALDRPDGADHGTYILYTAHSSLGQRREFEASLFGMNFPDAIRPLIRGTRKTMRECFVSDLLQTGETVTLYLQQGEEFDRCVAGLKSLLLLLPADRITELFAEVFARFHGEGVFDNQLTADERTFVEDAMAALFGLPPDVNFCEKVGIRVYEVDPPDGTSPAGVDLNKKYATLLADTVVDDSADVLANVLLKGIPFRRVSAARYFAVELTNLGAAGQIVLYSLQLMRSAHVSVQPRPARGQSVKAMHYRMIGPALADDFSQLGTEGFNFSIDRLTAGQVKDVLYSAMSLLDLLHTGGARIHSNARRRAVEHEKSISTDDGVVGSNSETRTSYQHSNSWRSSETGNGVDDEDFAELAVRDFRGTNISLNPPRSFEQYGNSESRVHGESLHPQRVGPWRFLRDYFDLMATLKSDGYLRPRDVLLSANNLHHGGWLDKQWKGIARAELAVRGTNSISCSPFTNAKAFYDLLDSDHEIVDATDFLVTLGTVLIGNPFVFLTGGPNTSVSLSPAGVGLSLGINPLPSLVNTATYGSTGSISKSASNTGYSFGQSLNLGGDISNSKSIVSTSEMKRIVTRKEVPDTDNQRVKGAEVMWQGRLQDIITGSIPLNFSLPATATKMSFRTGDDTLRVRFNSGFSPSVEIDVWFELTEEPITDDH